MRYRQQRLEMLRRGSSPYSRPESDLFCGDSGNGDGGQGQSRFSDADIAAEFQDLAQQFGPTFNEPGDAPFGRDREDSILVEVKHEYDTSEERGRPDNIPVTLLEHAFNHFEIPGAVPRPDLGGGGGGGGGAPENITRADAQIMVANFVAAVGRGDLRADEGFWITCLKCHQQSHYIYTPGYQAFMKMLSKRVHDKPMVICLSCCDPVGQFETVLHINVAIQLGGLMRAAGVGDKAVVKMGPTDDTMVFPSTTILLLMDSVKLLANAIRASKMVSNQLGMPSMSSLFDNIRV